MAMTAVSTGIDWQSVREAIGRLALEITESAFLSCLEPNPVSSCYEDELPRVRRAIVRARDGKLARFLDPVNRNAFVLGCGAYTDGNPEEHLLIGYGFRHGATTKVESLHHATGGAGSVRLPDAVAHMMWTTTGNTKITNCSSFTITRTALSAFCVTICLWYRARTAAFLKPARCTRSSSSADCWDRGEFCFTWAKTVT